MWSEYTNHYAKCLPIPKKQEYWLGGYFVLFFNPPELFQLEVHILDPDKKDKDEERDFWI